MKFFSYKLAIVVFLIWCAVMAIITIDIRSQSTQNQHTEVLMGKDEDIYSKVYMMALAVEYSNRYNVSYETMNDVINCESQWDYDIQSMIIKDGIREESYGLAQIHLPDHPDITKEQANDPHFALNFLAKGLSEGNEEWWACY